MTELPTKGVEVLGLFECLQDLLMTDGRRGFVGVAFDDGIGEKRSRFWSSLRYWYLALHLLRALEWPFESL
jgi:hypothetical protein